MYISDLKKVKEILTTHENRILGKKVINQILSELLDKED